MVGGIRAVWWRQALLHLVCVDRCGEITSVMSLCLCHAVWHGFGGKRVRVHWKQETRACRLYRRGALLVSWMVGGVVSADGHIQSVAKVQQNCVFDWRGVGGISWRVAW